MSLVLTPSPRMEATGQNVTVLLLKMCAYSTFIPALRMKMEFFCTLSNAAWQITPAELQKAESEKSQFILLHTRSGQSTSPVLNLVPMNENQIWMI